MVVFNWQEEKSYDTGRDYEHQVERKRGGKKERRKERKMNSRT